MPKNYHQRERKLWYIVKRCLENDYDYICTNPYYPETKRGFIDTGIDGVRSDIIGIKDFKGWYEPKLEIIAVEVKDWQDNYTAREMDQAKRASKYAHKVYLAAPREFKDKELELAVDKGIGLFEIVKRKTLKERIPPPTSSPEDEALLDILAKLGYYRCSLCRCYLNYKFTKEGNRFTSRNKLEEGRERQRYRLICDRCQKNLRVILGVPKQTELDWLWNETDKTGKARRVVKKQTTDLNYVWDEIERLKKPTKKLQTDLTDWGYYLDERISKKR